MANKHQVLKLFEKSWSDKRIAENLDCLQAYVRAVRAREFGNGNEVDRKSRVKRAPKIRTYNRINRDAHNAANRAYYNRKKLERARDQSSTL